MKLIRVTWTRTETFTADVEVEDHEVELADHDERLHPFEDDVDCWEDTERTITGQTVVDTFEDDEPVRDDR